MKLRFQDRSVSGAVFIYFVIAAFVFPFLGSNWMYVVPLGAHVSGHSHEVAVSAWVSKIGPAGQNRPTGGINVACFLFEQFVTVYSVQLNMNKNAIFSRIKGQFQIYICLFYYSAHRLE